MRRRDARTRSATRGSSSLISMLMKERVPSARRSGSSATSISLNVDAAAGACSSRGRARSWRSFAGSAEAGTHREHWPRAAGTLPRRPRRSERPGRGTSPEDRRPLPVKPARRTARPKHAPAAASSTRLSPGTRRRKRARALRRGRQPDPRSQPACHQAWPRLCACVSAPARALTSAPSTVRRTSISSTSAPRFHAAVCCARQCVGAWLGRRPGPARPRSTHANNGVLCGEVARAAVGGDGGALRAEVAQVAQLAGQGCEVVATDEEIAHAKRGQRPKKGGELERQRHDTSVNGESSRDMSRAPLAKPPSSANKRGMHRCGSANAFLEALRALIGRRDTAVPSARWV
jgi:hypothetical protein